MNTMKLMVVAIFVFASTVLNAQLKTPAASPISTIEQEVGLGTVTVEYSRPGARDRDIFGDLVAYGTLWRLGANASTKIEFTEDVMLNGQEVSAGKYALYAIPGEMEWTMILNSNLAHWGKDGYTEDEDVARINVKPMKTADFAETFTIGFSNFEDGGAHLNLMWANTKIALPITTNALANVEKQITDIMAGPDARTYASAAGFYVDNDKDLNKALSWIEKAIEMRPEAFWYVHQKAKIQGKLGMTEKAIATAMKSLEAAKVFERGDFGYIKNNEDLIAKLKGM